MDDVERVQAEAREKSTRDREAFKKRARYVTILVAGIAAVLTYYFR